MAAALIALGAAGCTAEDAPSGSADESHEDALDLAAAPSPDVILDPDRGAPPSSLQVEDLVVGSGSVAATGDVLLMEHLGLRWSDGAEVASSWTSGEPMRIELGEGQVIPGLEQGVLGRGQDVEPLRVGGRRVLTIPPELAYGDRGAATAIGPGETLVFVIDLVSREASGDDPPRPADTEDRDA